MKTTTTPSSRLLAGFTLIEMIVAVTILVLMLGGGISAYISFNERQTLRLAAQDLQTLLRSSQARARVGDRPSGCTRLDAYRVVLSAGSSTIQTQASCPEGFFQQDTDNLPTGVTPTSSQIFTFRVLQGGVIGAGDITLSYGNRQYLFSVGAGGEITRGDFVEN